MHVRKNVAQNWKLVCALSREKRLERHHRPNNYHPANPHHMNAQSLHTTKSRRPEHALLRRLFRHRRRRLLRRALQFPALGRRVVGHRRDDQRRGVGNQLCHRRGQLALHGRPLYETRGPVHGGGGSGGSGSMLRHGAWEKNKCQNNNKRRRRSTLSCRMSDRRGRGRSITWRGRRRTSGLATWRGRWYPNFRRVVV